MSTAPPSGDTAVPAPAVRPFTRAPEPVFLWLRHAPRGWPVPERPWTQLARGGLGPLPGDRGAGAADAPLADLQGGPFDDVVWLPPVPPERAAERDRLAAGHLERGTPLLVQVLPGDPAPPQGAVALHDLLPPLLERDPGALAALPAGAACLWPLVPGVTDEEELWQAGCAALAEAGAEVVQTVVPRLSPADRRRLADGAPGAAFHRLFHGSAPDERAFARVAAAAGLDIFLPRPLPRPPATGIAARRIAAGLFLTAELWLRLGRTPSRGQAYFRAARWVDESPYDPGALVREGNLGVVEVLDQAGRELIEDAVARGGEPALLGQLLQEYTAHDPEPEPEPEPDPAPPDTEPTTPGGDTP